MNKEILVAFADNKLKSAFEALEKGRYEDEQLYNSLEKAISDLKKDPSCGTKIPRKLWPKEYNRKFEIHNLWKYNLPNAWRLIYTITEDEVTIMSVLLEWFSHKEYEKRFGY